MTEIAFQVFKKSHPDNNGNFASLVMVYDTSGNITRAYLEGDSKPNTPHKLLAQGIPEIV